MKHQKYRQWANVDDLSPKGAEVRHVVTVLTTSTLIAIALMIKFVDVF